VIVIGITGATNLPMQVGMPVAFLQGGTEVGRLLEVSRKAYLLGAVAALYRSVVHAFDPFSFGNYQYI
jgi:hypothetical protein